MILDSLANAHIYADLAPAIERGTDYLCDFDPSTPDGHYPLDGDCVFALVQSYGTGPATEKRFEAHRQHLDIQFVAAGTERILHAPAAGLKEDTAYDAGKDIMFFQEPGVSSSLLLREGEFVIFFPGDAHKPGCMAGGRTEVKKVVVKVRIGAEESSG